MIDPNNLPAATASVESHADFLELSTLRSSERRVSVSEFMRDLDLENATEAILDSAGDVQGEEIEDQSEALAEAAFAELDERRRNCGQTTSGYPFRVTPNTIELEDDAENSLYTFLALLSWYGRQAGPTKLDGEKLFEEVCAKAAEGYLGGPSDNVSSFVFGFPRRVAPAGFASALDSLCLTMGEGGCHRKGRPKLPDQKDAKLDVVAWREFEDRRQGKLITFGQCATGADWETKRSELPPVEDWCTNWMDDRPAVWPVRSFFVPHRVRRKDWFYTCSLGGILYDRCRIVSLASGMDPALAAQWQKWSDHVLDEIRKS